MMPLSKFPSGPRTTVIRRFSRAWPYCRSLISPCPPWPFSDVEKRHHELESPPAPGPVDWDVPRWWVREGPLYPVEPEDADDVVETELERASELWPFGE